MQGCLLKNLQRVAAGGWLAAGWRLAKRLAGAARGDERGPRPPALPPQAGQQGVFCCATAWHAIEEEDVTHLDDLWGRCAGSGSVTNKHSLFPTALPSSTAGFRCLPLLDSLIPGLLPPCLLLY